jgi:hypothetical protein
MPIDRYRFYIIDTGADQARLGTDWTLSGCERPKKRKEPQVEQSDGPPSKKKKSKEDSDEIRN